MISTVFLLASMTVGVDPWRAAKPDVWRAAVAAPSARAKDTCECDGDPTQCTCGTSCECSSVGGDCRLLTYWREPSTGVVYEYRGDTWTGVAIDAAGRWWKDGKLLHAALPWRGGAGAACGT